jgi:hypothetical protein
MMNDRDAQMFQYLSTISFEEFEQWMDNANSEDIDYAISLYRMVRQGVEEQVQCLQEELEMAIEEDLFNMAGDFQDATKVLNRIRGL